MEIIKGKLLLYLISKFHISLNLKLVIFILINISLLFALINPKINLFNQNISKLRALNNENDPRSKGANENCMGFKDNDLYTLFKYKGKEVNFPDDRIKLKLCQNFDNIKSSCILKNGTEIIRLSGDINGEENNKNKFVINGTKIIKMYLAAGDICKDKKRYKVEIEINAIEEKTYDDDGDYDYDYNYGNYNSEDGNDDGNIITYSDCVYSIKINQYFVTTYTSYYGFILPTISFNIILALFMLIFGIMIKKYSIIQNYEYCYIICFIGAFFPLNIILDLCGYNFIIIIVGSIISIGISGCLILVIKDDLERNLNKFSILLGILCGYPMIKNISTFTIAFIETSYQSLIYYITLIIFLICGGIIGFISPELTNYIGPIIFEDYLLVKGLSYILYFIFPPLDENKIFDLSKTENYEKIKEMIGLSFIYPLIFVSYIFIHTGFLYIISLIYDIIQKRNSKKDEKNNKNDNKDKLITPTPNENQNVEVAYYEKPK